jgi:hypothetical protein
MPAEVSYADSAEEAVALAARLVEQAST